MPNLTNSELEKILSEYEKTKCQNRSEHLLTGEEFYAGISDEPFDSLSAGEKLIYNLIAEATNEILAEHEKDRFCGKSPNRDF